jgi:hypothetical protein
MKKKIIKIGNSQGLTFTSQEMNNYGMVIGDIIDMDDMFLEDVKSKRKNYKRLPKYKNMKKEIKEELK